MRMFYEMQRDQHFQMLQRESTGNVSVSLTINRCPSPDQFQEEVRMKDRLRCGEECVPCIVGFIIQQ